MTISTPEDKDFSKQAIKIRVKKSKNRAFGTAKQLKYCVSRSLI